MNQSACSYCGDPSHLSLRCFSKPRKAIKSEAEKTKSRRTATTREWFELNPPDAKGCWRCYLRISPLCPLKLTRATITLEHVKSKARHPELKYEVSNLKPSCTFCNDLKRSLDIEDLVKNYPHLNTVML